MRGRTAVSFLAAPSAFGLPVSSSIPIGALGFAGSDPVSIFDMFYDLGLGVGHWYSFSLIAIAESVSQ